jgi:hypothetical protein
MSERFEARVFLEWQTNTVRLAVREDRYGSAVFLMPDGTWTAVVEGATVAGETGKEPGIVLPVQALDAIGKAIREYSGDMSHSETEAKVLREWLAVEMARVDRLTE